MSLPLLLISAATLIYEILLTRIFSVLFWYHFAFMAVSIALFGITAGALTVFLKPHWFRDSKLQPLLSNLSLAFAVSLPLSILIQIYLPIGSQLNLPRLLLLYLGTAVPFYFSGLIISLIFTKFPSRIGKLYAADLAGAGIGCLLVIISLNFTDGPTTAFVAATLASLAAVFFSSPSQGHLTKLPITNYQLPITFTFLLFIFFNTYLIHTQQTSLIPITHSKGDSEPSALYEKWNSYSRVKVMPDSDPGQPFGWGFSPVYNLPSNVKELELKIDGAALTVLTKFNTDLSSLEYLSYDVANIAHHLRPDSSVLIIGSGGGRDILTALYFNQPKITAVEINSNILRAAHEIFADFTGRLNQYPQVTIINDEARSFLARSDSLRRCDSLSESGLPLFAKEGGQGGVASCYDLIQISLIDTWAANAAGAYVLSENSLYTTDAWQTILQRLSSDGIFSVSRWYSPANPAEMYRLVSLTRASLEKIEVEEPARHLVIVSGGGTATLLVSKQPFTPYDLQKLEKIAEEMQFQLTYSPDCHFDSRRHVGEEKSLPLGETFPPLVPMAIGTLRVEMTPCPDPIFHTLVTGQNLQSLYHQSPLDLTPPTDDRPFFFQMLKPFQAFNQSVWFQGNNTNNTNAVTNLILLLVIVTALSALFIILPLKAKKISPKPYSLAPYSIYFLAIGLAYLLIEIALIQKLTIFLGQPVYSLSVVLFTLLISSGVGSYIVGILPLAKGGLGGGIFQFNRRSTFTLLIVLLALTNFFLPHLTSAFQSYSILVRATISVLILFPLGLFMGMPFPLGIQQIERRKLHAYLPWFWGINGAASVTASVLAIVISLAFGISITLWTGTACYLIATLSFRPSSANRRRGGEIS